MLWAQGLRREASLQESDHGQDHLAARAEWFVRGRSVPGESAAGLRYRAHQQKLQLRRWRTGMRAGVAANTSYSTPWTPLGPAPLASDAGTGQDYNWVSGRATAVAIDPADPTGNTVYIGGAYGGVWKSTNAGPASTNSGSVLWAPVADYAPTLAVGAIAIQPGNSNPATSVILVGTGEPDSAVDSYYGLGILRSSNGGATWTLIPQSSDTSPRPFAGLGFSKIAFSTINPQLVVAAAAGASMGVQEGLEDPITVNRGIYYSTNGGISWKYASIKDSGQTVTPGSVTSVVYNESAQAFFAAVRYHGIYASTDGANWTRLAEANQPAGLTLARCPTTPMSTGCPLYRAELSVVPGRNEMYAWVVALDNSGTEVDAGIWVTQSAGTAPWTSVNDAGITMCGPHQTSEQGCGVAQGAYNLELLALPNGTATDIYAGAINIYKCTIGTPGNASCNFLNLTHVYGSCAATERVHPDQHHLAGLIANGKELLYFANDGGIYRALDGYTGLTGGNCEANQFDSLNQTLGSMTQFVSFSIHPTDSTTLLGGTQGNGSPATSAATGLQWKNVHAGDGGYNAILPNSPADWLASYPDTGEQTLQIDHCANGIDCTDPSFAPVVTSADLGNDDGGFYFPYILDPKSPSTLLIGTCRVWRVTNAINPTSYSVLSDVFEPAATPPCTGSEVNVVRAIAAGGPTDANGFSKVIYAGTDGAGPNSNTIPGGRIFVTTDAGAATPAFAEVEGSINPNHYPIASIVVDPSDASGQTAFVGIMGFHVSHVFQTTSAGASWSDFTGSLPDAPVNSLLVDATAGMIYAGTDVGVFVSPTSTANWTEVGPVQAAGTTGFLPNVPVTALALFNSGGRKLLRASTYGRGVWQYNLVTTPDFMIDMQNSPVTVFAAQTGIVQGTLTSLMGYSSSVALSCTGAAPSTCAPQSTPVTPTTGGSAFQINVGGAIGDYTFNVHGMGSDMAQITHDTPATVHVVDFGLGAPSLTSVPVGQGSTSNPITLAVTASGSFSGTVVLACAAGLPAGAQCNFSPASTQPTSANPASVTLTISTVASTPAGTSTVTIAATTSGAPSAKTQNVTLTVTTPAPDYTLTVTPASLTKDVNTPGTFEGSLLSQYNYTSAVNLRCGAGAPPACTVSPATVTPTASGAPFTVTVQSYLAQSYSWQVQAAGTDASHVTHSTPLTFTSQFTFALVQLTGPQTVAPGQSASFQLTVTPPSGLNFLNAVTIACVNPPAEITCSAPSIPAGASGVQNVTLVVTTLGANMGASQHRSARSRGNAPFVVWISAAGLVLAGISRKEQANARPTMCALLTVLMLAITLISCGGSGGSSGGGGGGGGVSVSVSPKTRSLFPTQQQQFTATVTGSTNNAVNWTASLGTVDASGLYTAPAVTSTSLASVTAVALADVTRSSTATVTIQQPTQSGSYTLIITATSGSLSQSTTAILNVQ
jgi:hypothetical protein